MNTNIDADTDPEILSQNESALFQKVKALVVNAVNLHHLDPSQLSGETPFGPEGLNLDSVDILEIIVTVEHQFECKVPDADTGRQHFHSLNGIVEFLQKHGA